MVEHVLAALGGLGVDNCEIWVNGCEMPGCDGSSQAFVDAILDAGLRKLSTPLRPLRLTRTVRVAEGVAWAEARPASGPGLSLDCRIEYPQLPAIGSQQFRLRLEPTQFCAELAASRTFLLQDEADQLRAHGLGTHVTTSDLLVFGPHGPIDNRLRFPDECVRHKMLDLVGDLALAGAPLWADVVAYRSGHRLNAELIRTVLHHQSSLPTTGWRKTA
jgi:UDP-3-O-acyl N-acetylglucosamine deacetylase